VRIFNKINDPKNQGQSPQNPFSQWHKNELEQVCIQQRRFQERTHYQCSWEVVQLGLEISKQVVLPRSMTDVF
jgi:hypothetical protein